MADNDDAPETCYEVLGVSESATKKEIRSAFRELAQQFHPDKVPSHLPELRKLAEERFKEIEEAYEVLKDSAKRAQYDRVLKEYRKPQGFPQKPDQPAPPSPPPPSGTPPGPPANPGGTNASGSSQASQQPPTPPASTRPKVSRGWAIAIGWIAGLLFLGFGATLADQVLGGATSAIVSSVTFSLFAGAIFVGITARRALSRDKPVGPTMAAAVTATLFAVLLVALSVDGHRQPTKVPVTRTRVRRVRRAPVRTMQVPVLETCTSAPAWHKCSRQTEFRTGKRIFIYAEASNVNYRGKSNVAFDFEVLSPGGTGEVYRRTVKCVSASNNPYCWAWASFRLFPGSGLGSYSVRVEVRNNLTGRTGKRTTRFTLLPPAPPPPAPAPLTRQGTTYSYGRGYFTALGHGQWEEHATNGLYHFREESRVQNSDWIYLRDDSRNINVRIPVGGGLSGFQFGPLRRQGSWNNLYTVNLAEQNKLPPTPAPLTRQGTIYTYGRGYFTALGNGQWEEHATNGLYHFREMGGGRDSNWIYLRDSSRNINVRIPVGGGLSGFQFGPLRRQGRWNNLHIVNLAEQNN